MTVKQKEKATEEEKTSTEAIPQNSIGCVDCCGPVTLYVTPILPLLLLLETMTETQGEWGRERRWELILIGAQDVEYEDLLGFRRRRTHSHRWALLAPNAMPTWCPFKAKQWRLCLIQWQNYPDQELSTATNTHDRLVATCCFLTMLHMQEICKQTSDKQNSS